MVASDGRLHLTLSPDGRVTTLTSPNGIAASSVSLVGGGLGPPSVVQLVEQTRTDLREETPELIARRSRGQGQGSGGNSRSHVALSTPFPGPILTEDRLVDHRLHES